MNPGNMPKKSAPVRTTVRYGEVRYNCDYERDGKPCTCEGVRYGVVERVRVIRPLGKRNPAMADALQNAGW